MKAIFVQIQERKSGVKVTAWWQNFLYEESRHHVYLTKNVYRNDKKSTVPAFAKATQQEVPEILKTNVYFWRPGGSASWRRSNEQKRNAELADFMKNNKAEAEKKLNEMFAEFLKPGEKILVDRLGAYLNSKGKDYHFFNTIINKRALSKAREVIEQRRE